MDNIATYTFAILTYIHRYSDFLVRVISVGLALVHSDFIGGISQIIASGGCIPLKSMGGAGVLQ